MFLLVCAVISLEFSFNRDGKPHSQPLLLPFIYFANITMEPKASGMMSLGIPFQFTRFSAAFAARSVQVGEDCLPVGLGGKKKKKRTAGEGLCLWRQCLRYNEI